MSLYQCHLDYIHNRAGRKSDPVVFAVVNEEVARVCKLRNGVCGDPEDCSRYYWCQDGRAHRLRCSRGQYFHAVSGLCMYGDPSDICRDNHVMDNKTEVVASLPSQQIQHATAVSRDLIGGELLVNKLSRLSLI